MAPRAQRSGVRKLSSAFEIEADGRYWSLHSLPPGEYRLDVGVEDGGVLTHTFDVSAGATTEVFVGLK